MVTNIASRLARLETSFGGTCGTCYGWPTRIVGIEEDTGALISENMPASGCPECGRQNRSEMTFVGIDPNAV
jgi:hypothetical protein